MREIWRVKFRVSPDEYVYVHAVPVVAGFTSRDVPTMGAAFCGREVPANMQAEPSSFDIFINKELVNCPECANNAMAYIRNPDFMAGSAK